MTQDNVENVKSLIVSILEPRLLALRIAGTSLPDGFDLRDEGLVDSLAFMQLILDLEARLGSHIDLTDLNPEYLTNVGALSRHIAGSRISS